MVSALIEQMQSRRCLLVLDESDSLFETTNLEQHLEYKLFFRRLIEEMDQSCLLLTNRVFPDEFEDLIIAGRPIQYLKIKGLETDPAMQLLFDQGLDDEEKCNELIKIYYGNPLELKTVVTRIHHFFGGSIQKFFENRTTLFSSQFKAMLDKAFGYLLSKIHSDNDQAPLGRGVGCGVWGVGEEIAPITSCVQAPSSLHPTPYPLHPTNDDNYSQLPPLEITVAALLEARQNINPLAIREADKVERMRNRASLQGLPSSPIDDSVYSHGNINIFS